MAYQGTEKGTAWDLLDCDVYYEEGMVIGEKNEFHAAKHDK